ncbi:unnamed protein product [Rotaria sordida]|uniref:Uncharacterized protein n=1 Tax=Rotaria sordida TaxID=392033 RepID=A0A818X6S7_9BILA|nr:unnamed protein product [Rotaria sordida]CAF3732981.1 unnamed protein product [Rotaria sordida]
MMNNICHSSSPIDFNIEKPSLMDHQSSITGNDSVQQFLQKDEKKPCSSYLKLSADENQNFGLSNFQDPLFYEQPLDFHYNRTIPTITTSEYETGDQIRLANDMKFSKNQKQISVSSYQHEIDKSRSNYRQHSKSKKNKNQIRKMKEKKKKPSIESLNKRKHKNKKINRNHLQQFQRQPKSRQQLFLKHHHKQQELFLNKKKRLLKQRVALKKESILKMNKNKSLRSTQHRRRFNITNNRINSNISSNRSLTSGLKKIHSISQSKTKIIRNQHLAQSNKNRTSSISQLIDNPKTQIISNKIKSQANLSTLNPVLQSNGQQMIKIRLAPINENDKNMMKSIEINKDNIQMKMKPSLFPLKNSLNDKVSSTSTIMPLTKNNAQLTSKNNNRRGLTIKRQRNDSISTTLERTLIRSTGTGMILRPKTIIINSINSTKRTK